MTHNELDVVVLAVDLPEFGLRKDDLGTIVHIYTGARSFEVEFVASNGDTIAMTSLKPEQILPFKPGSRAVPRVVVA